MMTTESTASAPLSDAEKFELKKINLAALDYKPEFVSAIMQKNKLYILTEKEILVFSSVK